MANRRWKRLGYGLLTAAGLLMVGFLALRQWLPPAVERRAIRWLAQQGLKEPRLTVKSVGPEEARIADIRFHGEWGRMEVDALRARYPLRQLLRTRLGSLELEGLRIDWNLPGTAPTPAPPEPVILSPRGSLDLWPPQVPFDRLQVSGGLLRLHRDQATRELPFSATLAVGPSNGTLALKVGEAQTGSMLQLSGRWADAEPPALTARFDLQRPSEWMAFLSNGRPPGGLEPWALSPLIGTLEANFGEAQADVAVAGRADPLRWVFPGGQAGIAASLVSARVRREGLTDLEVRSGVELRLQRDLQLSTPDLVLQLDAAHRLAIRAGDLRLRWQDFLTMTGDVRVTWEDAFAGTAAPGALEFNVRTASLPGIEFEPFTGNVHGNKDRLSVQVSDLVLKGPGRWRLTGVTGELHHPIGPESEFTAAGHLEGLWPSNLVAAEALPFQIHLQHGPRQTAGALTLVLTNVALPLLSAAPADRLSGQLTVVADWGPERSEMSTQLGLSLPQALGRGWTLQDAHLDGAASVTRGAPPRSPVPGFLRGFLQPLLSLYGDGITDCGFDLLGRARQARTIGGLTVHEPILRIERQPGPASVDRPWAAFELKASAVEWRGIRLADLQVAGSVEDEWLRATGTASLDGSVVPLTLELRSGPDPIESPQLTGNLAMGPLQVEDYALPSQWTGGQVVSITGEITLNSAIRWLGGEAIQASPVVGVNLAEVHWPDRKLTLTHLRTVFSLGTLGSAAAAPENLLAAARIRIDTHEITDVTASLVLRPDGEARVRLIGARIFDGQASSNDFQWNPSTGDLDLVLHLEDLDLARLAREIPHWQGSLSGRVDGRFSLSRTGGMWRTRGGRIELDRGTPARLEYPAEGMLTGAVSPESPRYAQLRLVEDGLRDLALRVLTLEVFDSRHPPTAARIRIEGTSTSPRAIVPIVLTVNLNGQFEELLRLLEANP